jgi:hypothetical protein
MSWSTERRRCRRATNLMRCGEAYDFVVYNETVGAGLYRVA